MEKALIVIFAALCALSISDSHPASSRQLLPPRPGYVPVYIRNGDTPLEDINLALAEAFHAIPSGRSAGRKSDGKAGRSEIDDDKNTGELNLSSLSDISIVENEQPDKTEIKETSQVEKKDESEDIKSKINLKKVPSQKEQLSKPVQDDSTSKFIQKIPKSIEE